MREALLAAADDELVLGHRDSEWTGLAPHIEADVALSSIAQDEMSHAQALYQVLAPEDPDALACGRERGGYRHAQLLEVQGDFAFTVIRQYLYDIYEELRIARFLRDPGLRAIAVRMAREETYHRMHDRVTGRALGRGLQEALNAAWPLALGLFEPVGEFDVDIDEWKAVVEPELQSWGLAVPSAQPACGGRAGRHTGDFDGLWEDLTGLFRADPTRHW